MKLKIMCPECNHDAIRSGDSASLKWYVHEINHENLYYLSCDSGHKTAVYHQALRFEILVDLGLWALKHGLQDSAYLKFFAALEDFRLFFIRSWLHSELDELADVRDVIDRIKRSEPQSGAFILLFRLLNKVHPASAPNPPNFEKLTELRNRIAHQGYIAPPDTAAKHCNEIMDFIVDTIGWARTFIPDSVQKASSDLMLAQHEKLFRSDFKGRNGTIGGPTAINFSAKDIRRRSLEEAMSLVTEKSLFVSPTS